MTLVAMLLVLIAIGVFFYFIPMDAVVKQVIVALVAFVALVLVLQKLGVI